MSGLLMLKYNMRREVNEFMLNAVNMVVWHVTLRHQSVMPFLSGGAPPPPPPPQEKILDPPLYVYAAVFFLQFCARGISIIQMTG